MRRAPLHRAFAPLHRGPPVAPEPRGATRSFHACVVSSSPSSRSRRSASHAQGDVADAKLQTALWPLGPKAAREGDGQWIFLGAGGARVYVWEVSGEFAHTTGALATGSPPKKLPALGFTDGDLVAVRPSGPFLLVTASDVGAHPRLYELPEGRLVFASDTARAVTFWPGAAKPETHEEDRGPKN